jgi:hypothetical protein
MLAPPGWFIENPFRGFLFLLDLPVSRSGKNGNNVNASICAQNFLLL